MQIGNKKIGEGYPCFIIGEIGSNHNQDLNTAYRLIDMACEAGVDAVKFQTLKPNDIAKMDTPANVYGEAEFTKGKKYWHEVLNDIVMPYEWHKELFQYAKLKGLIVFSTPESIEAVDLLEELEVPVYKIASMDIGYKQLLERIGKTNKPVILSSGIASVKDIFDAIEILRKNGTNEIALLHCVSDYPPKYDYMSLEMINYYKNTFNIPIGLSDHCEDNLLDGVAVALGAKIIEKHITLDKRNPGPDHSFALDKKGLKNLVQTVRNVEKAIPINEKLFESKNRKKELYGRSIICIKSKKAGEQILLKDIDFKRPGNGITPKDVEKIIGLTLKNDIEKNHVLRWEDFQ
ncbi:N-acetylneuraminate synthase family protein [Crassaminicella indica]|uniref:N-acetylneuraminate synthase family protein n=1 Tax=Crassaminicella indica TaxID=2855394 RepID=A0ABX8RBA0_9CLOT|nr:N-acetylneuraminate synthase family protein [Crassaminicella indica]QXM05180.1 N-acetylneuraminate synthase family protein [Crassaminicella indica]